MPLVTRQVNQGNVFNVATEPTNWLDGDLWIDIGQNPPILKLNDNGTARPCMWSGILAQGDITVANAANEMGRLALGTATQIPEVNTGATALEYEDPGILPTLIDNFKGVFNTSLSVSTDFITGVTLSGTVTFNLSITENNIALASSTTTLSEAEAALPFKVDPSLDCFFTCGAKRRGSTFGQFFFGIYDTQFPSSTTNGFGFTAVEADTNYTAINANGTTSTTTDTGVANSNSIKRNFKAFRLGSSIFFFIDGVEVAEHTTNLPLTATAVFRAEGRVTSSGAGDRGMDLFLPVNVGGADF